MSLSLNNGNSKIALVASIAWGTINHTECIILYNWVVENFILANEPFAKALKTLKTYASVNNNLSEKLVSSLEFPIKFDERPKVTSVQFLIPDFNFLSCELGYFTFKVLHLVILY